MSQLSIAPPAVTPWVGVTFTNSWVNEGTLQTVQYRKVGDDVQIRGYMKNGTIGIAAFTLPAGFRPPVDLNVQVLGAAAAAGFYWVITTAGAVSPAGASNTLSGVNGTLTFSTIA